MKKSLIKTLNRIGAVAVAVTLFINVPAYGLTQQQIKDANSAGGNITEIIKFIVENYVGDTSVEALYKGAMSGMMDTLDQYAEYYEKDEFKKFVDSFSGETLGVGIMMRLNEKNEIVISKVLNDTPASNAGLMSGDIIRKVNDKDVSGLTLDKVMEYIADKNFVTMVIERKGKLTNYTIQKAKIGLESVYVENLSDLMKNSTVSKSELDKIGYIIILQMNETSDKEFANAVKTLKEQGKKRIIIDLRGNPGGILDTTINMCKLVVPEGVIATTVDKTGQRVLYKSELKSPPFEKIVILTDENTASAAEVFTSAMQDAKAATVIGQKTYGKGVVQGLFDFNNGGMKLTIMEYFSRNGRKINDIGITPDIAVFAPTFIADDFVLDNGKTSPEVLNIKKALQYMNYPVGEINNTYDAKTEQAVIAFQKDKGINQDGRLTYETINAINEAVYEKYYKTDPVLQKGYEVIVSG